MWTYRNPVRVIFGAGKLEELASLMEENGLDQAILVADPFSAKTGLAEKVKDHKITIAPGRHEYSAWLQDEMKRGRRDV